MDEQYSVEHFEIEQDEPLSQMEEIPIPQFVNYFKLKQYKEIDG